MSGLGDIETLPGGQFMAACIDAVEHVGWVIRFREEMAAKRGQAVDPERLEEAAASDKKAMVTIPFANGPKPGRLGFYVMNAMMPPTRTLSMVCWRATLFIIW